MKKFNVNQNEAESVVGEDMNNSSIYLPKCDLNGVPLLRRVEKYPDLPEDEFIPIKDCLGIKEGMYKINKKGEVLSISKEVLLKGTLNSGGYKTYGLVRDVDRKIKNPSRDYLVHRLVATMFLENPNPEIYKVVNHIDCNKLNNSLSNLEFTTPADNNSSEKVSCKKISEDKLINYVAIDDSGNEIFRFTEYSRPDLYNIDCISRSIKNNRKYKGYYWKKDNKRVIPGFSGNLEDYEWLEHWKYPGILYVSKEGFVRIDNNIFYSISHSGYVIIQSRKYKIKSPSHRIIMEYLLGRDLEDGEIVDHINTIKTDNNFSNLRVTDAKGNMNNPLTIEKLSTKVVLTDLSGKFIMSGYPKEVFEFVYKRKSNGYLDSGNISSMIVNNILNQKYLCIRPGDIESLHKKMKKVTYVFNKDKTELLGAYHSAVEASKNTTIKPTCVYNHIYSETIAPDNRYYLKGPEAVKLVIKLGYGMANEM
jgi:hypothetical protein